MRHISSKNSFFITLFCCNIIIDILCNTSPVLAQSEMAEIGWSYPPGVLSVISTELPGYRVPNRSDFYTLQQFRSELFYSRGDFNGDGIEDIASFVIGKDGWRLYAFHGKKDGQFSAHEVGGFPGPNDAFFSDPIYFFKIQTVPVDGLDFVHLLSDDSHGKIMLEFDWSEEHHSYGASVYR